jgi:hypothetical protein
MNQSNSRIPKPAQLEVQWAEPESFSLITQLAVDGDRVAKEAARHAADQYESDQQQTQCL